MEFLSQCVFWSFGPEGFGNVCCRYIRLACCLCTRIWEDFLRCSEGAFPLLPLLILDVLRFTSSRDIQSLCEQMLRSIFDTRDNVTIGGPQNVDRLNPRTQTTPEWLVPHASVTQSLQEDALNCTTSVTPFLAKNTPITMQKLPNRNAHGVIYSSLSHSGLSYHNPTPTPSKSGLRNGWASVLSTHSSKLTSSGSANSR